MKEFRKQEAHYSEENYLNAVYPVGCCLQSRFLSITAHYPGAKKKKKKKNPRGRFLLSLHSFPLWSQRRILRTNMTQLLHPCDETKWQNLSVSSKKCNRGLISFQNKSLICYADVWGLNLWKKAMKISMLLMWCFGENFEKRLCQAIIVIMSRKCSAL